MMDLTMNEDRDFAELKRLADSLSDADFDRSMPPPGLWADIEQTLKPEMLRAEKTQGRKFGGGFSARLLAAAAVFIAAILVASAIGGSDEGPQLVAQADLLTDTLPVATDAEADVNLVRTGDGYALDIDLTSLPVASNGELELWIINDGVDDMHSLGVLMSSGRFALPDGVDPEDFPIIDISVEPFDGNPAHSGQSTLRGRLAL